MKEHKDQRAEPIEKYNYQNDETDFGHEFTETN